MTEGGLLPSSLWHGSRVRKPAEGDPRPTKKTSHFFNLFFIFLSLINIYLHGLPKVWIVAVSATVEGT